MAVALRPWAASLGLAVVLVVLLVAPGAAEDPRRVNVLLLYSEPRVSPSIVAIDEAFRSTLEARLGGGVYFYTEFLDVSLFIDNVPQRELRDLLIRKYAGRRLDLVVAVSSRGLRIAVQNRPVLFPGVPIVFVAVDPAAAADVAGESNLTGTWLKIGWSSTLDIAMRLQPASSRRGDRQRRAGSRLDGGGEGAAHAVSESHRFDVSQRSALCRRPHSRRGARARYRAARWRVHTRRGQPRFRGGRRGSGDRESGERAHVFLLRADHR